MNFKFLIIALIFLMAGPALTASSQTAPEFLLTWRAGSYGPSHYQGKILPSPNSSINIAFDLISGGKVADLSKNQVQWIINGKLINSGLGLKNLNIGLDKLSNTQLNLIIKTIYKGVKLEKFIIIPIAKPEVVIETINQNTLRANPYFFNVAEIKQLTFNWVVNGQNPVGAPDLPNILELEGVSFTPSNLASNAQIDIGVTVTNIKNQLEKAMGRLFLKI